MDKVEDIIQVKSPTPVGNYDISSLLSHKVSSISKFCEGLVSIFLYNRN